MSDQVVALHEEIDITQQHIAHVAVVERLICDEYVDQNQQQSSSTHTHRKIHGNVRM